MTAVSTTPLKLSATDTEDLTVISACLQDAVTVGSELQYLAKERKFAAVFSRFRWEDHHAEGKKRWVRAGVHFNCVLGAQSKGFNRDPETVLELLALEADTGADGSGFVQLSFAGGASIRLQVECIDCHLTDMGEPWAGRRLPTHPVDRG
jgi:hypothetical protein